MHPLLAVVPQQQANLRPNLHGHDADTAMNRSDLAT